MYRNIFLLQNLIINLWCYGVQHMLQNKITTIIKIFVDKSKYIIKYIFHTENFKNK